MTSLGSLGLLKARLLLRQWKILIRVLAIWVIVQGRVEYEEDNAAKIVAIQFLSYDFVAIKGLCELFFF